jgi:hypothetical protein
MGYSSGATFGKGYEHTGLIEYIREKAYRSARRFKLDQSNNYRAIRYADVLLMAAEANSRGGIR